MVYLIRQAPVRASIETPTPLEDITSYFPGAKGRILAKVEGKYPNTSVKDRIAEQMLDDAEADGIITPSELPIDKQTGLWLPNKHGNIITEGTSGNTGFGLVNSGIPRGYRVVLAIPQKMDPYKVQLLRSYGASVIVVPTDAAHGSPESYTGVAERLAFELNGFFTNQHNNPSNSLAHYRTTGPEIYMQTDGKVTYLVAGSGTGGTISGTGRFLKEKNPTLKVIGVDPVGSPLQFIFDYYRAHARLPTKDEIKPHDGAYKVEGIGMDHKTGNTDLDLIDEFLKVADRQAFGEAKSFYLKSRLTVGGSSGAALAAVRQLVPRLTLYYLMMAKHI
ncbi:cysteine synthase family protein [Candidatus Woesearchaeota archaeon]|nr:cysteine synthase family protein [Candidatus Woesearchaeota archaeon]